MKELILSLTLLSVLVILIILAYKHLPEIIANGLPIDPNPHLKALFAPLK